MASIFISYAREDGAFARRLTGCLQDRALDYWIDWEDIPPTVDWWQEIEKGIEQSDIFLFLLSPESAASEVCQREIEHAVQNGKRLIPLVVRQVDWHKPVPHLSQLNYIFFRESDDFDSALEKLLAAIHTDFEWVQQHRWLQVRALDWQRQGRDPGSLLRGRDLQNAESGLAQDSSREPHPTGLQRSYVHESRLALDRQRRLFTWISAAVTLALAGLALFGFYQARTARNWANQVLARQLVVQARSLAEEKSSLQQTAVLLAIRSARIVPSVEALQILQTGTRSLAPPVSTIRYGEGLSAVAFRLDGKRLVSAGGNGQVRIWEPETGREIATVMTTYGAPAVDISPDARYVATGGYGGALGIRDLITGQASFHQVSGEDVLAVRFSPDGRYLAASTCQQPDQAQNCNPGRVYILEILPWQEIGSIPTGGSPRLVAFSPDGQYVASGGCDRRDGLLVCSEGTAHVWQVSSGWEAARISHAGDIFALAFSPDGHTIATAGSDGIRLWDFTTGREMYHLGQQYSVSSVAFSPDGKQLASGGWENTVRVWEAATGREILKMSHDDGVTVVGYDPAGRYILSGSLDQTARLWEAGTGQELARMTHGETVQYAAFSPDGRYVASGSWDGMIQVWQVGPAGLDGNTWTRPRAMYELDLQCGKWDLTYVAPNGSHGCNQSLLDIRERGTDKKIAQFASDLYRPWSAYEVSQDGKYLTAADNQAIRVWELATRRQITRIPNNENVKSLAISPDGKYLVSGSGFPFNEEGATARIWELSTGKQRIEVKHDNLVVAAAFSQDGKYVASATCTYSKETNPVTCIDSQVRVWDVRTGSDVIRLVVGQRVRRLAFSPDDRYIIADGRDAWLWRVEDLIQDTCQRVSRNLTPEEWNQYLPGEPYRAICPDLPPEGKVLPTITPYPILGNPLP